MNAPDEHVQGDSKWKPGDRALIEMSGDDGERVYQMATLRLRDWAGQWWFEVDGVEYPEYEGGPDLSFCIERWIHEPPVLDKMAEI